MKEALDTKYRQINGCLWEKTTWYPGHVVWGGKNIDGWTGQEHVVKEKVLIPDRYFDVNPISEGGMQNG